MYVPYFIAYMLIGLGIALPVLWWALNNGQFRDQQRARFLPLEAEPEASAPQAARRMPKLELITLFVLAAGGLAASAAVLVFAILNHHRV